MNTHFMYGILLKALNAAPSLWTFTSLMTPPISGCSPVERVMFSVTQYLSHWSSISTMTAIMAYSMIKVPFFLFGTNGSYLPVSEL